MRFPNSLTGAALLGISLTGCYGGRPVFVEPGWGSAPEPHASQIAEVTHVRTDCRGERCKVVGLVLLRSGVARRSYATGDILIAFASPTSIRPHSTL